MHNLVNVGTISIPSKIKRSINSFGQIEFYNPSYTHKVWRNGIQRTGTIVPMSGYSNINWRIENVETRSIVASGTGTSVTHTFTYATIDACNTYDLIVSNDNGIWGYERIFPFEFTCLPQVPTVYDRTVTTATYLDDNWTNRPGYKVRISSSFTGTFQPTEFKSDDPTQPQHWVFDNCTITSLDVSSFKPQMMKNVIFDGCTNEDIPFGLKLYKAAGGGLNQQMVFDWNGHSTNIDKFSQNVTFCGMFADGGYIGEEGNTGFRILPAGHDATVNADTRQFNRCVMFNCKAINSWDEGFYIGYFTDSLVSGYRHTYIDNSLFYNLHAENCGREAFQIAAKNTKVGKCFFKGGNLRQIVGHRNCVQLSGGSDNIEFFHNWVETTMDNNVFVAGAGETGGNVEVHNNVFYNPFGVGDIGNIWGRSDLSVTYPSGVNQHYYDNTIICNSGTSVFILYEAFATPFNKFRSSNNIMICTTTQDYLNGSGMEADNAVFSNNYKQTIANINSVGFVNTSLKDFRLSSLSSPVFGNRAPVTVTGAYSKYDFNGYKRKTGFPSRGAFSGVNTHFNEPLTSIDGVSQVVNGITYTVESAQLSHSIQKLGNNLFRFEVNQGEGRISGGDTGKERAELSGSGYKLSYGSSIWTSYSFMIDASSQWINLPSNIIGQFNASIGSPNLYFRMEDYNKLEIVRNVGVSSSPTEHIDYTNNSFIPGKWYNVVIESTFTAGTATGILRVWIDGVQVVNLTSIVTGYSDAIDTFFKYGIFRDISSINNEIVLFANVEQGTTNLSDRILNPISI